MQDGNTYADKLNAMLGARDVPDLLCIPGWEIVKIPRFADAVKALFEDLTPYLAGDAVAPYKMLARLPDQRLAQRGVGRAARRRCPGRPTARSRGRCSTARTCSTRPAPTFPKTLDELYAVGKAVTDPAKGVWAFNDIFPMVQMFHKVPGSRDGWRRPATARSSSSTRRRSTRRRVEFMAKLYKEGLVHPDIVASKGADSKQLFSGGKIVFMQDGLGAWQGMQAEQAKVTPGFNMQPVPIFSADRRRPAAAGAATSPSSTPSSRRASAPTGSRSCCACSTGAPRRSAPRSGSCASTARRASTSPGTPTACRSATQLAQKEIAFQYGFLVGRVPAIVSKPETPNYVKDMLTYSNAMVKYLEKDPWEGIKLEMPANYSKIARAHRGQDHRHHPRPAAR